MSESAPMEGGKRSAWMSHVKKTMKANKGKPLSAVLKMAAKTYKKTMRGGGIASTALPLSGGRRRSRRGGDDEPAPVTVPVVTQTKFDDKDRAMFEPRQVRRGGRKTRKSKKNGSKKY
jgi:hypothetical protein